MDKNIDSKGLAVTVLYLVSLGILLFPMLLFNFGPDDGSGLFFYLVYGAIALPMVVVLLVIAGIMNRRRNAATTSGTVSPRLISGLMWSGVSVASAVFAFLGVTVGSGLVLIANDLGNQSLIGALFWYTGLFALALAVLPLATFIVSVYKVIKRR